MTVPVEGPPRCIIKATIGRRMFSAIEKGSCNSTFPGPAEAVKAFLPAKIAPIKAKPADISSSVCRNIKSLFFDAVFAQAIIISVAGVIGYPVIIVAPTFKAALTKTSSPITNSLAIFLLSISVKIDIHADNIFRQDFNRVEFYFIYFTIFKHNSNDLFDEITQEFRHCHFFDL